MTLEVKRSKLELCDDKEAQGLVSKGRCVLPQLLSKPVENSASLCSCESQPLQSYLTKAEATVDGFIVPTMARVGLK
jgi:hypothetical protein